MKRLTISCSFGKNRSPFHIYVGDPLNGNHPLKYQYAWLAAERDGEIPQEIMDGFAKINQMAVDKVVSFEQMIVYALGTANRPDSINPLPSESLRLSEEDLKVAVEVGKDILAAIQNPVEKSKKPDLSSLIQKAKEQLKKKADEQELKRKGNQ